MNEETISAMLLSGGDLAQLGEIEIEAMLAHVMLKYRDVPVTVFRVMYDAGCALGYSQALNDVYEIMNKGKI